MKKLLAILVACLMPICLIAGSGDVNGDGKVNKEDLSLIVNVIMGIIPDGFDAMRADVNDDGKVNAADIVEVVDLIKESEPLEYEYCSFEEDGMEGVLTDDGLYAVFVNIPESKDYIFKAGRIEDDQNFSILYDSLGFMKAIINENELIQVLYSPEDLWLINKNGTILAEIPYKTIIEKSEESIKSRIRTRSAIAETPLYHIIDNANTVFGYLKNWKQSLFLDLSKQLLNLSGKRSVKLAGLLAETAITKNWFTLLKALDTEVDYFFFADASLTALDAIENSACSFITPCEVNGLFRNTAATKFYSNYCEIMDITFTLKMSVDKAGFPHNEPQTQETNIDGDGTYLFSFDFQDLEELYEYKPSLTMDLTLKGHDFFNTVHNTLNPLFYLYFFSNPSGHVYHRMCTIVGEPNTLNGISFKYGRKGE